MQLSTFTVVLALSAATFISAVTAAAVPGTDSHEAELTKRAAQLSCAQRKIKAEQLAYSRCYVGVNHCVSTRSQQPLEENG
jgi:hypothetical protein